MPLWSQVCQLCKGTVLNGTEVSHFCTSVAGRIEGRCCVRNDNASDPESVIVGYESPAFTARHTYKRKLACGKLDAAESLLAWHYSFPQDGRTGSSASLSCLFFCRLNLCNLAQQLDFSHLPFNTVTNRLLVQIRFLLMRALRWFVLQVGSVQLFAHSCGGSPGSLNSSCRVWLVHPPPFFLVGRMH